VERLPGLGRRAERRKIEVGLIRGAVVKARVRSSPVVKVEISTNRASRLSAEPVGSTPAATQAFVEAESEHWRQVIDQVGIKID
jgi:hypothetical protein